MQTDKSDIRDRAKAFVHRHLHEIVDLRRANFDQMKSEALRGEVEKVIRQCLTKIGREHALDEDHALVTEIVDEAVGLGPLEVLLRDEAITEIMVNGHEDIFIERGGVIEKARARFVSEASLRQTIDRVVTPLGRRIDEASPMVDARLPDGSRFNAIIPPLSLNGPTVTIRKFSKTPISLDRLIQWGSITSDAAEFLDLSVKNRRNILIAGGTGSGKTTLLNALSAFIPRTERIITIEDAAELKLPQEHVLSLEARPSNVEGKGAVSIRDLVRNALRMRPDRIVVGECRGGESLDMLQAMNTGHDGSLTTAHANSPRDALLRLETMVMMAGFDLPLRAIREQIASALDLIVFQSRFANGRRAVTHITEICGTEGDVILSHDLFRRERKNGDLKWSGRPPRFLEEMEDEDKAKFVEACRGEA